MTQFGALVSPSQVEAAVTDTLKTWLHTYLGATERESWSTWAEYPATGCMPRPRSYTNTQHEPLSDPNRQIPRIIVESPGWSEVENDGDTLSVTFQVNVVALVKGKAHTDTARLNADYAATIVRLFAQKTPDLVDAVEIVDMNLDVVDAARERTFQGSEVVLALRVSDVVEFGTGPLDPAPPAVPDPPTDYPDWPAVDLTDASVVHVPLDEEIEP